MSSLLQLLGVVAMLTLAARTWRRTEGAHQRVGALQVKELRGQVDLGLDDP